MKCGNDLFHGKSKYSHSTPWPAFSETIREDSVRKEIETVPQESSRAKAMKVSRLIVSSLSEVDIDFTEVETRYIVPRIVHCNPHTFNVYPWPV